MTESSDVPEKDSPGEPASYPLPPYPIAAPSAGPKNGLGVAALVIAVAGLVTSFTVLGGVILGVVAVVFGFIGRGRVRRGEANNAGVALTGVVLGFAAITIGLLFIGVWIALWANIWDTLGGDDYVDCLEHAGSDRVSQQQCADQFNHHLEDRFGVTLTPTPAP